MPNDTPTILTDAELPENPTTNFDKWMYYMKDIGSPESFKVFGYYTMIAAALQRRVWYECGPQQCFPNMFTVLCGPPGVGKGQVITQINKFLKYNKFRKANEQPEITKATSVGDAIDASYAYLNAGKQDAEDELLFPVPADSSSLRSLTNEVAKGIRTINLIERNKALGLLNAPNVYSHCSSAFILEEFSSLVKSQQETKDLVRFLIVAWDCGDYRHSTYNNGTDVIRKVCISLLAGTTPDFMQETFDSRLMAEGFTARTLFIYEIANRSYTWLRKSLDEKQVIYFNDIAAHLLKLSKVYGPIAFDKEADEMLSSWYEVGQHENRLNTNHRLDYYYARKDMHIRKLAAAIHFSEKTDNVITLAEVERAMALLESAEHKMHLALNAKGKNALAGTAKLVLSELRRFGAKSELQLLETFMEEVRELELREILRTLLLTKQITFGNGMFIYAKPQIIDIPVSNYKSLGR
jgi:hypothetical protein